MDHYQQLLARGVTQAEIARQVRAKELVRIRRGSFVSPHVLDDPEALHLELILATLPALQADSVLSQVSAAVVHDLPVPMATLRKVHVTREASGRITKHVHRHQARLPGDAVAEVQGLKVTSLERTTVDLTRWLPFPDGVAVADAALRRGALRPALAEELERARRRPGNERARRVIAFANPLAESPGESRSRALMAQLDLPIPVLQREFRNAQGEIDARVDFDWEKHRVCGEFDGLTKYGRLLKPGQTTADAALFEKHREERLKEHGRWTVRWRDVELRNPPRLKNKIEAGFKFAQQNARPA